RVLDETDPDESRPYGPDESERDAIVAAVIAHDGKLGRPDEPLDLGDGLRWTPDLADAERVVHVELGYQVPRAFIRRLRAARATGRKVVVATKAEALTSEMLEL